MPEEITKFVSEMNRGFLQILVLVLLETPMYGYLMLKHLESKGYKIEESTLYPLLRRLEKNKLVKSAWSMEGGERPKKFYSISPEGQQVKQKLLDIRAQQDDILTNLLNIKKEDNNVSES